MPKKFKVGYKTINAKLKVTKNHLNKIKDHVSARDKKDIAAQIKAIDVIISACAKSIPKIPPLMSRYYLGK
jgi:hypothetical protein